jgi:hypothetical protein
MTEEQETDARTVFLAKELLLNQQRLDAESSNRIWARTTHCDFFRI